MRAPAFGCQKRSLASGADFDFHAVRIAKFAGKFNEFRTAKADFVFLTCASRFFEKHSKYRLCKANILCATRFLPVQDDFSLRRAIFFRVRSDFCVCRAYFACATYIFSAQSIISLRKAKILCAKHIFCPQAIFSLRRAYFLCATYIFSAQSIFSLYRAYFRLCFFFKAR